MVDRKLPAGWESRTLGEVADITMGQSPPGSSYNQIRDGCPFLQGNADFGNESPTPSYWTTEPQKMARKGSILFSVRAPIGAINIANTDYCIGRGLSSISLHSGGNKYLYFLLRYLKPSIEQKGTGSTFKAISKSTLEELVVPIPPLGTQRKIVAILDKAEATQRLRAEADELMQQLLQSVFLDMFGDPEKNPFEWQEMGLSEVLGESLQNGLYKPSTEYGEGTPILRIDSFYEGKIIDIESLKRLHCSSMEIEKYGLDVGDILINRVNSLDYLGKCGLVEYLPEPTVYESNMMRVRLNYAIANPFYITSMLCTSYVKGQIISRAKKAVNQASINQDDVLSLKILVPPIGIQKEYENRVRGIEGVQRLHKKSQIQQETLMKSLLSKTFTGDLIA